MAQVEPMTTGELSLDLDQAAGDWPAGTDWEDLSRTALAAAARRAGLALKPGAAVSILLTDDATIRAMNRDWRAKDAPTNVLSFQSVPPDRIAQAPALGDIVLACETVGREAIEAGVSFEAHASHLIVHGFLHLLGFDHEEDEEAERMEALETAILADLGIADPYAELAPEHLARPA